MKWHIIVSLSVALVTFWLIRAFAFTVMVSGSDVPLFLLTVLLLPGELLEPLIPWWRPVPDGVMVGLSSGMWGILTFLSLRWWPSRTKQSAELAQRPCENAG